MTSTAPPRDTVAGRDQPLSSGVSMDIRRFPWISRLAADYAFDFARVADFYAGDPGDPAAWHDAIVRTQRHPRQRDAVAALLERQQERRNAPAEARDAAAELRDTRSVAVVTGQQAGLFGGPLFTLLKALTALRLADEIRTTHHVPAVAIFWVDAEDHDWDEVKQCHVLDPDAALRDVAVNDPPGANVSPVARLRLDAGVDATLAALREALPPTEHTDTLLDGLRQSYAPDTGMADAFARWLERLLGPRGLIVYDSSDPEAKPLAADVFAREIEHAGETSTLAAAAGSALAERGYHAQVTLQDDSVALFHMGERREPIKRHGETFLVGGRTDTPADLLDRVRSSPQHFSPNVLLRPLVQDTLFPTVCYVAGPSELAYLGQLRRVYASFGIPMPLVYQRATATLVDSNAMRFLTRYEFPFEALRAQDESALNALLEAQLPPSVDASLQDAIRSVDERLAAVAREVQQIDATLEGAARSTLGRMQDDLKKLQGKIIQAAKRKDETLRRQYHHARAQAFPAGHPQERQVGMVYFLNKYGPALVERLAEDLPLQMGTHSVLTI